MGDVFSAKIHRASGARLSLNTSGTCVPIPHSRITVGLRALGRKPKSKRTVLEIDAEKLQRLAASLGLFSSSFLESVSRSEKEIALGKTRRPRSLRELRR